MTHYAILKRVKAAKNMETQPTPSVGSKNNFLKQMEDFFDLYLHKKIPFQLPSNAKEYIVKFGPWLILVIIILVGLNVLQYLAGMLNGGAGIITFVLYANIIYSPLSAIIILLQIILLAMALQGLFKRSIRAWYLLYYVALLSALGQLVTGQVIGAIISLGLSLYLLFQIKEYYK